jgi:hypothetical protein
MKSVMPSLASLDDCTCKLYLSIQLFSYSVKSPERFEDMALFEHDVTLSLMSEIPRDRLFEVQAYCN